MPARARPKVIPLTRKKIGRKNSGIRPVGERKFDPNFVPSSGVTGEGHVMRLHAGPVLNSSERLSGIGATTAEIRGNPKLLRLAGKKVSVETLEHALRQIRLKRGRGEEVANW